jgi:2-dehydro-3-deoxyphosphogluconate aldolase/(4S)-4-hydroxy-2-oxoglutarate aldolase
MPKNQTQEPSSKEIYKRTLELIEKEKIIFLLTGKSTQSVLEASKQIQESGFNLIGIDFQIPGVKDFLKSLKRHGRRDFGVFSVSTQKEARIAINAGAVFIFSAHVEKGIVRRCRKESTFHSIGALTPTEVYNAFDLRADTVSLFPCGKMGGLGWFLFIRRMSPRVKMIPTDWMSPFEAVQYIKSGAYAVAPIIDLEKAKELDSLIEEFTEALA